MALPLYYNVRNVRVRWQLTLLAVGGIALVVAVFAVLMSMSEGFAAALRTTGRPDNAMIVQRGSSSELTSAVPLADRNMIVVDERVARDASGQPLASWEWVVVIGAAARERRPARERDAARRHAARVRGARRDHGRRGPQLHARARRGDRGRGSSPTRIAGPASSGGNVKYQQKRFRIVGVFESDGRRLRERDLGRLRHARRDLPARRGQQLAGRAHEGPGHDPRARPLDPRPAADAAAGALREEVLRGAGGPAREHAHGPGARSWPWSWASAPCSGPSTRCTRSWPPAPARSARCGRSASRAARSWSRS